MNKKLIINLLKKKISKLVDYNFSSIYIYINLRKGDNIDDIEINEPVYNEKKQIVKIIEHTITTDNINFKDFNIDNNLIKIFKEKLIKDINKKENINLIIDNLRMITLMINFETNNIFCCVNYFYDNEYDEKIINL